MSLFCCPLCAAPLEKTDRTYRCPRGHSFDRAREGYVHLLPANRMHSKAPGDDKAMAAARNRFLSGGWYAPLRDALCRLAVDHAPARPAVLDSGCGEGYYTAGVWAALAAAGKPPETAGVDLSKPSLRWAARREPRAEFAVASVYHLPVAPAPGGPPAQLLFAPGPGGVSAGAAAGGVFLYVVPAAGHLWELKQVLYERPYPNPEEDIPYEGFDYLEVLPVEETLAIRSREPLLDLFQMTPYRWKTPRTGVERLEELEALDVTASFRIHVFRRK